MNGRVILVLLFLSFLGCATAPAGEEPEPDAPVNEEDAALSIEFTGKVTIRGNEPHTYAVIFNEAGYYTLLENELEIQLRREHRKKTITVRGIVHEDAGHLGSSGLLEVVEILAAD